MKEFDLIEMKLPAKADYVGVIRLSVSGIAQRMGFTFDDIEDIKVSISEAVSNVVKHAYTTDQGEVSIRFKIYEDRLEIIVADAGASFDFEDIRKKIGPYQSSEPIETLREGGLGLFLIKQLMDDVQLDNENGVCILMTKYHDHMGVSLDGQVSFMQKEK